MDRNDNNLTGDKSELHPAAYTDPVVDGADDEKEIDLLELALKLWQKRKKIFLWCFIGGILGLVVAFSIPREYETTVTLAPELGSNQKMTGGLGAMAAMVGLNGSPQVGTDAINPTLYPDVVSSVPFLVGLFNVPVEDIDHEKTVTLREYVEEDLKAPWWSAVIGLPFKVLGMLLSSDDEEDDPNKQTDSFRLTKAEDKIVTALRDRIEASVDTKTAVISISVKMQDPLISAVVADTVVYRLQDFITDYRTNKARQDLQYAELLNREAQENYYKAQQKYADYLDRNNGLILHSAQTTRERLQNEATLAFNLYNQTSQHVQSAKAKVQEDTPVYAIVSPPSVPIKPVAPRKVLILIGFVFLSFVACAAWILYGQPLLQEMKTKKLDN